MLEKIIQKNTEKSEISEQLKGLREQLTLLENKIKTAGMQKKGDAVCKRSLICYKNITNLTRR